MLKLVNVIVVVIFCLVSIQCSSNKEFMYKFDSNYRVYDDDNGREVISGAVTWKEWLNNCSWNLKVVESKGADPLISKSVCNFINNGKYFLLIYGGAWCEDSKTQMPMIFKMIQLGKLKESRYQLIGVDKNKDAFELEKLDMKITKVPTVIVFFNNKEIGRVVEFPEKSWEQDILNILYKH